MEKFFEKHNISYFEAPCLRSILSSYDVEYEELVATIEKEKKKEAAEVNLDFKHIITDTVKISDEQILSIKKIGTPVTILKIDSPYKEISKENLAMILGSDYPEKWTDKNNLDLFFFRKVFLPLAIEDKNRKTFSLTQSSAIDLMKNLKDASIPSPEASVLMKFAGKLLDHELIAIESNLLGTKENEGKSYELSEDSGKNYWALDVIEHLNKSIVMHASAKQNERELDDMIEFYEGKRINVRYFDIGASLSKIEFEYSGSYLFVYLSSTICAYFWNYEEKIHVGRPEMLQYTMFLLDNLLSLSLIRSAATETEKKFIDYYVDLLNEPQEIRVGMGGSYETTCLLMSDIKTVSSSMPILDNLIESIKVSLQLTERLVSICYNTEPSTCIKMSSIGKTLVLASTNPSKGINRYTQRTNRDNPVNQNTIRRLRSLFRQKVILSYIKKHGRVPTLLNVPEDLGAQLEMKAAGGNYQSHMVNEVSRYDDVKLGKFLDPGNEMNLQSRIIDKACTKDQYNPINNSEKEIQYYISNDMEKVFKDPMGIDKTKYKEKRRWIGIVNRKDPMSFGLKEFFTVRLSEKEKEQKTAARFYGIASFKLKLWISSTMEMIKRAMKLLPGQMMTMTDDERREIMFKMSEKLLEPDAYSLFLDYSGHNTSQRPENTSFILEEIANMYGYFEMSPEYEELTSLAYVFSNINVIVEDNWSDNIYYSKGQLGAIEGWLGGLWGIQSQLMLEDMFMQLGVKDYIGTTYSDDSCGVFTQPSLDVHKLNGIVRNVQKYGEDMGLIVKLSQTQVTNGRCSMLKEHYYKGTPIDMNLKKMMAITPNGPKVLFDETEACRFIDSGYTSSCTRSTAIEIQTVMRNFRAIKLLASSFRKFIEAIDQDSLDKRYLSGIHNYEISVRAAIRSLDRKRSSKPFIPAPRSRNIEFFQFHREQKSILDLSLMLMYGPFTTYGYSLTPMPDVLISGYSLSNVKRICYLQGILGNQAQKILGRMINLSENALSYIDNPFPMVGGRRDTALLIKPAIEEMLPRRVKNKELSNFLGMYSKEEEIDFKSKLITVFSNSFSSRIVSKFYECSLFSYVAEILSKIDNASTMKMLLGARKMMSLINKAWTANYKMKYKLNEIPIMNYDDLLYERNTKKLRLNKGEIILKFIGIEEIPLMGKVIYSPYKSMMQPIFKGTTKLTSLGNKKHPPQRTFMNVAKFDRELGVDGMFEHKLIFKAYDLVRYVKWLIMEQEKFSSGMEKIDEERLIKICDETLKTFTDAKYEDIQEHVVSPKGGRYFHRALTGGFNPKTGDLSSNLLSTNYDITGIDQLLAQTGGVDNNLNIQYLIIYTRICFSFLQPKPHKLMPLSLSNDILYHIKDVTFRLTSLNDIEEAKKYYDIASKKLIQSRGKMYYNYSTFVASDDNLEGKFLNHVSTTREAFIEEESAFRSVHSYMTDQMIVSPELISDNILESLIGSVIYSRGRGTFFDKFYRYYKSLNIIGNETPSRSVIRGLLYEELFRVNENSHQSRLWTHEMARYGYSSGFKDSLMRLFVLATSLSYRIVESSNNMVQIVVNQSRTVLNSKSNFERMRKGLCQFYIKDKRITEMILHSFPTLGYNSGDVRTAAVSLCYEIDGKEFEQLRLGSYYLESHQSFTGKKENCNYGFVGFKELEIDYRDLLDNVGIESALKGFETSCSLMMSPEKISSPTLSAVYPSARGLLSILQGGNFISKDDRIIELCAGRGDFHLAMMEAGIEHTSLSREDGYNLAMRIPGMTSKKVTFNCFRHNDYIPYFDHSIILLDISHITDKDDCLSNLIGDIKMNKKKIILRLNGLNKFMNESILNELQEAKMVVYVPELESPGYVYLTIDFSIQMRAIVEHNIKEIRGYKRSLLSSALINSVSQVNLKNLITIPPKQVEDQTQEIISDHVLGEMILEEDPEYVHINLDLDKKIKTIEDFEDRLVVYCTSDYFQRNKTKLELFSKRMVMGSRNDDLGVPKTLHGLSKKARNLESDVIEVGKNLTEPSNLLICTGVVDMSLDDLVLFIEEIAGIRYNKRTSLECWKLLLSLSINEKLVDSSRLINLVNVKKFKKGINRTINLSYEIASKAILSFKTGRIIEGLLCVANMENVKRKVILSHKDKSTRTNILHYKLYMNRIMLMARNMETEPWFIGVDDDKFVELWSHIGVDEDLQNMREIQFAMRDETHLNKLFEEMNKEYFHFLDQFDSNIDVLVAKLDHDTTGYNELEKELEKFGMNITDEEIQKNSELNTQEKLEEYLGEEEMFELWGQEDLGDWGDVE